MTYYSSIYYKNSQILYESGAQSENSDIHETNKRKLGFYGRFLYIYVFFTIFKINNFTFDMAAISESLNSSSILRLHEQNMILKFMQIKSNEPRLTKKNFYSIKIFR